MNYEDYVNGNITSAQVQTPKEDWSDYFTSQVKTVPLDKSKTYAEGKAAARPASSYMDMAGVVTVRPAHELELRQQLTGGQTGFHQKSIEQRLAEEMRQYNQRFMDAVEPKPKADPKDHTVSKTKVEPVEPVFDNNIEDEPVEEVVEEKVRDKEPVISVQEEEHTEMPKFETKQPEISGLNFVPGGMEFVDEPGGLDFVDEAETETEDMFIDDSAKEPAVDDEQEDIDFENTKVIDTVPEELLNYEELADNLDNLNESFATDLSGEEILDTEKLNEMNKKKTMAIEEEKAAAKKAPAKKTAKKKTTTKKTTKKK